MFTLQKIQQYKWALLFGGILILCLVSIILFMLQQQSGQDGVTSGEDIPTPSKQQTQPPFTVTGTLPANNATNVFAGEQIMTMTTNTPLLSEESFSLTFSPSIQYAPRIESSFPTTMVYFKILGGFAPNTNYTASVRDDKGVVVHTWTFTTSGETGEADSGLRSELDRSTNETYYPLIQHLPYSTPEYLLGYADHLTLKITLKQSGLDRQAVLNSVKRWVNSHGINPDTHEYVFSE